MVIKFNTTDYLTYRHIYGLDNFTILYMLQRHRAGEQILSIKNVEA